LGTVTRIKNEPGPNTIVQNIILNSTNSSQKKRKIGVILYSTKHNLGQYNLMSKKKERLV